MSVQVFGGFDGVVPRDFFFAKACSNGSSDFNVTRSSTARLSLPAREVPEATAVQATMPLIDGTPSLPLARDAETGDWRLLLDLPPAPGDSVSLIFESSTGFTLSPDMDKSPEDDMNVARAGWIYPAYVARVAGSTHQASKGVGGRSACTAIAAFAALRAMMGSAPYWEPAAVDQALRDGTALYNHFMRTAGGGLPAGVEHTEFDAVVGAAPDLRQLRISRIEYEGLLNTDGRAFLEIARELCDAGRRRPEGLAVTCAAQTLVAVALPGPPHESLVRAVDDFYRGHRSRWRAPPLAALPCTLLVFDSHRHTAERGGAREAAWLLFPSPEALAAYLGLERFPCFLPDDPGVTEMEILLTRQFAYYRFHAEASAPRDEAALLRARIEELVSAPPPATGAGAADASPPAAARGAALEEARAAEEARATALAQEEAELAAAERRAEAAPCDECEALMAQLAQSEEAIREHEALLEARVQARQPARAPSRDDPPASYPASPGGGLPEPVLPALAAHPTPPLPQQPIPRAGVSSHRAHVPSGLPEAYPPAALSPSRDGPSSAAYNHKPLSSPRRLSPRPAAELTGDTPSTQPRHGAGDPPSSLQSGSTPGVAESDPMEEDPPLAPPSGTCSTQPAAVALDRHPDPMELQQRLATGDPGPSEGLVGAYHLDLSSSGREYEK
eukprot:tig00001128_g7196.t1